MKPVFMKYRMDLGHYPTTKDGLQALRTAPLGCGKFWQGPYLETSRELLDPWKNDYRYVSPGGHNPDSYDLWSNGPDGLFGTADDVGNWRSP